MVGKGQKGVIETCQTAKQRGKNKNAKKENEQGSDLEDELWERVVPNAGLGSLLSCKLINPVCILPVAKPNTHRHGPKAACAE